MCGEKTTANGAGIVQTGSPPRVRGEADAVVDLAFPGGITPACAGRRQHILWALQSARDHPRVCGEKAKALHCASSMRGSPPRVRGEGNNHTVDTLIPRITPACAGRRKQNAEKTQHTGDHPRVCGEKENRLDMSKLKDGSPPRVRGEARQCQDFFLKEGITPACAGRRSSSLHAHNSKRDHPRVCGEKQAQPGGVKRWQGSPPRVRGEEFLYEVTIPFPRITPACAGRSRIGTRKWCPTEDHPRVCGEKSYRYAQTVPLWGSPPRVRGEVRHALVNGASRGITPACAGRSHRRPGGP